MNNIKCSKQSKMGEKSDLEKLAGNSNVFDDSETLDKYAHDESFARPLRCP